MLSATKLLLMGIAVVGLGSARGQSLSSEDQQFIQEAAKGGMLEVHMGQMGVEKASSPELKKYSQRLINDHSKANRELAALAKKKGVTLPKDDSDMAATMPVAKANGGDFDKQFAKAMIDDHEKDVAAFEESGKLRYRPGLEKLGSETLPTLKAHLKAAQALPQ